MEKRKLRLLRYFLNKCCDGYRVLEISKLFTSIKKYKSNFELLSSDIDFLKHHQYIDVKYLDESNICLKILDNSHVLQDNLKSNKSFNRRYTLFMLLTMIASGVMAFIGAFLAIILIR